MYASTYYYTSCKLVMYMYIVVGIDSVKKMKKTQ